jgi:hypothetical protein
LLIRIDAAQHVSGTIVPIIRSKSVSSRGRLETHPAVVGWKHIHLGIYTETGGCGCSLKELLMMGTMVPETC